MASIMDILKIKPFVEVSVGQLLWGYEDPLLKLAKDVVPKEQKLPYEEFGLMYGKNGTSAVSKLHCISAECRNHCINRIKSNQIFFLFYTSNRIE